MTLPQISTITDGFKVSIVKWTGDANAVTVARTGSDTINGATSATIGAQYSQTTFVADYETNQWFAASSGLGTSNVAVDVFSGNNSTTAFTLSGDPGSKNNTMVEISGVYQQKSTYTVSGTTLTFSTAPPTGTSNIEVVWTAPLAIGTPSDGTVTTAKLASTTGSGAVVLATSPTVTTPTLASANITTALTLTGASGTAGQALTSGGSGAAPTWTTIGASAATPTVRGTVWASGDTGALGNQSLGYNAALNSDGVNAANQTAIGQGALQLNVTGSWNTALGFKTLYNTTASLNCGVGGVALYNNTTGTYNTAVGHGSMFASTSGGYNSCFGNDSGKAITSGTYNTCLGQDSGRDMTSGGSNVMIGRASGQVLTTGTNNIYIGYASYASGTAVGSENVIGFNITGKGSSTSFIGGTCYQGNNSSSWTTTSDQRLKKNIVDNTDGLDVISQIRVRNFEYRTEEEVTELPAHTVIKKEGVQLGVIAQELEQVCPDCIKTESTGVMSVNSDNVFWHMVNAIKDLKALNDTQAETINALTARVTALEGN
jgi:hypothetical protein